jgi:hypothetical protein
LVEKTTFLDKAKDHLGSGSENTSAVFHIQESVENRGGDSRGVEYLKKKKKKKGILIIVNAPVQLCILIHCHQIRGYLTALASKINMAASSITFSIPKDKRTRLGPFARSVIMSVKLGTTASPSAVLRHSLRSMRQDSVLRL